MLRYLATSIANRADGARFRNAVLYLSKANCSFSRALLGLFQENKYLIRISLGKPFSTYGIATYIAVSLLAPTYYTTARHLTTITQVIIQRPAYIHLMGGHRLMRIQQQLLSFGIIPAEYCSMEKKREMETRRREGGDMYLA